MRAVLLSILLGVLTTSFGQDSVFIHLESALVEISYPDSLGKLYYEAENRFSHEHEKWYDLKSSKPKDQKAIDAQLKVVVRCEQDRVQAYHMAEIGKRKKLDEFLDEFKKIHGISAIIFDEDSGLPDWNGEFFNFLFDKEID